MKKRYIVVVFIVVLSLTLQMCVKETAAQRAKRRVETILNGITSQDEGRSFKGDQMTSLCMWWNGTLKSLIGDTPDKISDQYDRWRKRGNIFSYITDFTITNVETSNLGLLVSGTIEGESFKMMVIEGKPITWVQPPQFEEGE
jgi:hypothetical protein